MNNSYHPRICSENYPILKRYDKSHLAVRALQSHAEACDICVGKEIAWEKLGNKAIEHQWTSKKRGKEQIFSGIAYQFISYDLVLNGWLKMPSKPMEYETAYLKEGGPLFQALLDECEESAKAKGNIDILPLVTKAKEFTDLLTQAILLRFIESGISDS